MKFIIAKLGTLKTIHYCQTLNIQQNCKSLIHQVTIIPPDTCIVSIMQHAAKRIFWKKDWITLTSMFLNTMLVKRQ